MKRKKLSRGKIVKKLDSIFSQYIRRRDVKENIAECFTCGKKDDWKRLQCGHFQSRRFYSTRWDETNLLSRFTENLNCSPNLKTLHPAH